VPSMVINSLEDAPLSSSPKDRADATSATLAILWHKLCADVARLSARTAKEMRTL